jgi:hypothetical protein
MIVRVEAANHVRDYVVRVRFTGGTQGEVDLAGHLDGPVFEPLRDPSCFRSFEVHPELHTLVWPNGADFAPEFLYEQIKVAV